MLRVKQMFSPPLGIVSDFIDSEPPVSGAESPLTGRQKPMTAGGQCDRNQTPAMPNLTNPPGTVTTTSLLKKHCFQHLLGFHSLAPNYALLGF